jgi:hypothetical protein
MCLRRAPEKYIASAKAPAGAALDRAAIEGQVGKSNEGCVQLLKPNCLRRTVSVTRTESGKKNIP